MHSALRITLIYAAVAAAWIYFSDSAVHALVQSADDMLRYSVWKGVAFVAVTALLLFGLMLGIFGRLDAAYRLLVNREGEIARVNRLYAALSDVNQASLWCTNREALFQQVCQALVEQGGLKMAWVGQPADAPARVVQAAAFGDTEGFLAQIQSQSPDALESCPATTQALRKGRPVVNNDLASDPDTARWQQLLAQQGFAACAAFPVREGDAVGAVLSVYAGEAGFFQDREVELLRRATTNLAYAIDNLRREQLRQAAEARARDERQLSLAMLESAPGILFLYNQERKLMRWNHNMEQVTGHTAAEIATMQVRDFFMPEGRGRVDAAIDAIFAGTLSNVEARLQSRDGRIVRYQIISHRVEVDGKPCVLGQGVEIVPTDAPLDGLPAAQPPQA